MVGMARWVGYPLYPTTPRLHLPQREFLWKSEVNLFLCGIAVKGYPPTPTPPLAGGTP
jgi:hypothetical protein